MSAGVGQDQSPACSAQTPAFRRAARTYPAGDLKRVSAVQSVEVAVFSCVEALVAVTVAPGIGVFPDFTIPVTEKLGAAERVLRQREARDQQQERDLPHGKTHVLKPTDPGTPQKDLARPFMRAGADESREPLIIFNTAVPHPTGKNSVNNRKVS